MNQQLFTLLWKQWPAGWHIRSLDSTDGHYVVELLSECPPFRHLTSGSLLPWDKVRIVELARRIMTVTDNGRSAVPPPSSGNFFGLKSTNNEKGFVYYYSEADPISAQAKAFVEMVAMLDAYFSALNLMIRTRPELYVEA